MLNVSGGFVNHEELHDWNPASGATSAGSSSNWTHPDEQLAPSCGVTYGVRYVGCIPVLISIKAVEFDTRTKIARECIHRVSEEVGLKLPGKRKRDKKVSKYLGPEADKSFAMSNANITITTEYITIMTQEDKSRIAAHNLFHISFASGGDAETMDLVSYVAKDDAQNRACYVIECPGGLARDLINTIGQAFQIRYREFVRKSEQKTRAQIPIVVPQPSLRGSRWGDDPPDSIAPKPSMRANRSVDSGSVPTNQISYRKPSVPPTRTSPLPAPPSENMAVAPIPAPRKQGDPVPVDRLIDFDSSTSLPSRNSETYSLPIKKIFARENANDGTPSHSADAHHYLPMQSSVKQREAASDSFSDDFNPRAGEELPAPPPVCNPFTAPQEPSPVTEPNPPVSGRVAVPENEPWFLGRLSRQEAERLLRFDGDFLVRGSMQQGGQYILSGRQDARCKHLLLVDPNGEVRTKDRVFDSISHLVRFHIEHGMPIKSFDSELQLLYPITSTQAFD